jgi:hypothetical protein
MFNRFAVCLKIGAPRADRLIMPAKELIARGAEGRRGTHSLRTGRSPHPCTLCLLPADVCSALCGSVSLPAAVVIRSSQTTMSAGQCWSASFSVAKFVGGAVGETATPRRGHSRAIKATAGAKEPTLAIDIAHRLCFGGYSPLDSLPVFRKGDKNRRPRTSWCRQGWQLGGATQWGMKVSSRVSVHTGGGVFGTVRSVGVRRS